MWEGQVAGLAGDFRTITYDWRGTGASAKPRSGYTCETVAADLCALIERLQLGPSVLVAHGIGTHATILAAVDRPDLVRAIVLASGAPWFSGEKDGVVGGISVEFMDFLAQRTGLDGAAGVPYAQACAELAERWLFHRPQSPAVLHSILEQALSWPQYVINAYANSMKALDHRGRLERIACPVLLLQGRHDRKQRFAGALYMEQLIPDARLRILEHSAHMGQIEDVGVFNESLRQFLGEL
jgi:3-oxoadipate enol-lactonase